MQNKKKEHDSHSKFAITCGSESLADNSVKISSFQIPKKRSFFQLIQITVWVLLLAMTIVLTEEELNWQHRCI